MSKNHWVIVVPSFVLEITPEEVARGFDVVEHETGTCLVRVPLRGGLHAIKTRSEEGTILYAICDDHLEPLYAPARSLNELEQRFAIRRR